MFKNTTADKCDPPALSALISIYLRLLFRMMWNCSGLICLQICVLIDSLSHSISHLSPFSNLSTQISSNSCPNSPIFSHHSFLFLPSHNLVSFLLSLNPLILLCSVSFTTPSPHLPANWLYFAFLISFYPLQTICFVESTGWPLEHWANLIQKVCLLDLWWDTIWWFGSVIFCRRKVKAWFCPIWFCFQSKRDLFPGKGDCRCRFRIKDTQEPRCQFLV